MNTSIAWIQNNVKLIKNIPIATIPMKFHMIWVGDTLVPEYAIQNFLGWAKLMPHWEPFFWKNDSLTTDNFSQEVLDKVNEAKKGAQKADILRYYIIEKYGGFYIDTDTVPIRSLDPLIYLDSNLVLYHDNDLTWEYICNSPFGAIPHHPVVKEACKRVLQAQLNTEDIHFKTGPGMWGTVISEIAPSDGTKYSILHYTLFSNFHNPPDKLGTHTYAASWVTK